MWSESVFASTLHSIVRGDALSVATTESGSHEPTREGAERVMLGGGSDEAASASVSVGSTHKWAVLHDDAGQMASGATETVEADE